VTKQKDDLKFSILFKCCTLFLHIQTVKPRVSLIQVAEPSVQKIFSTIKWVVKTTIKTAPTAGSATYTTKSGL